MYLGIDLGTTNSVVSRSFVDRNNNLVTEVVNIGQLYDDNWENIRRCRQWFIFQTKGESSDVRRKGNVIKTENTL